MVLGDVFGKKTQTSMITNVQCRRTSIIRTPVCQFNHKSVQISEFVRINEAHLFIYYIQSTTLIEHTLTLIERSPNGGIL